ncbi:MAG TPA: winged helix-turn-helix domain-containing protein [Candidatus Thermoplasmatota archaeon]|nr:winged helix-turn-helix domain-containing protein [Candidatus Thermoplasmatota archaeon]
MTKLTKADLLRTERIGNERVFYLPSGGIAVRNQSLAGVILKNDVARRIHDIVSQQPGITMKGIAARLMGRASSLRWHVKRLVDEGLLCLGEGSGRATEFYPGSTPGAPCRRRAA